MLHRVEIAFLFLSFEILRLDREKNLLDLPQTRPSQSNESEPKSVELNRTQSPGLVFD